MSIQDNVVTLETAQAMRDAGIEMETVNNYYRALTYRWDHKVKTEHTYEWLLNCRDERFPGASGIRWEKLPAPMLSEVLRELPEYIPGIREKHTYRWVLEKDRIFYYTWDYDAYLSLTGTVFDIDENTKAEGAAGKLLIWCKENGH